MARRQAVSSPKFTGRQSRARVAIPNVFSLLDPPVPLHFQIRQHFLNQIVDGTLKPGDQLPPETELMRQFGVSRITVRQALGRLAAAGVIYRRSGLGTFVAHPRIEQELKRLTGFVEDMEALGLRATDKVVRITRVAAEADVASHLRLEVGTPVTYLERIRLANEQPLSFDVTYLPEDIGERVAREDLEANPVFSLLENKYGIKLGEADYVIEASLASRAVAKHLGVRTGTPILLIERTTYSGSGRPIDFEKLHYRGDRLRYRMKLTR